MSDSPEPAAPEPADLEPDLDQSPGPKRPRRWRMRLLKVGAGVGIVVTLVGIVGVIWGDRILTAKVLPRIEAEIEDIIDRPFELGDVEGLAFVGVQLGKSTMPATETDESFAIVDAVEVEVDLRSLIFERTLRPRVVLIRPDVSLAQSEEGEWLEIGLPEPSEDESLISLEIQTVEVQGATLSASVFEQDDKTAIRREPIRISDTDALVSFYGDENERVSFDLDGRVEEGSFKIKGEGDLDQRAVNANVRSQNLEAEPFNLLLPEGVGIRSGLLESNLTVKAALTEDNKLDQSAVDVRGTARLREGEVVISELAEPVRNIQSQLRFKGQQVTLEETGLQVGSLSLIADGSADWEKGYNISATVPSFTLDEVKEIAEFESSVAVDGALQLTAQLRGEIDAPRVRGRLANLQPVQVEQFGFERATADFVLTPDALDLTRVRLDPVEGGHHFGGWRGLT